MERRIELEDAITLAKSIIHYTNEIIEINIQDALGYIIAQDIYAPIDQPPFSKSALDGYTFNYGDVRGATKANPAHLKVIDLICAGEVSHKIIGKGEAIHIMTGAKIPEGCNAVIRFEDTNDSDDLEVYKEVGYLANICLQGEDTKKGQLIIHCGEKLDHVRLAILAGMGISNIKVYRPLRIGICVTGSEVVTLDKERKDGQIYDQNMMLLTHRLKSLGYDTCMQAYVEDDEYQCVQILLDMCQKCDLIITVGGVSVGLKDILHPTLDIMGAQKIFWGLRLKPGSPTLFSMYHDVPIISLSGNPFASTVMFELFVREMMAYMNKDYTLSLKSDEGILLTSFDKPSRQRRFIRAINVNGKITIPSGTHSNNEIGTLIDCNALIDVPQGSGKLHMNDKVRIWLL